MRVFKQSLTTHIGCYILAFLLYWSCEVVAAERLNLSRALSKLGYEEVELRRTSENRLFLFARINGRKRSCLVDSGWSFASISTNTAARLALSNTLNRLELGNVSFTNHPIAVQDLRINGQPASFDLVLGCDFLLAHHAILDTANRRLYLRRTAPSLEETAARDQLFSNSGYSSAPLKRFDPPVLTITAQLNGRDTPLLVDSGAMFSCLDTKVARQINLRLTTSPNQISGAVSNERKSFDISNMKSLTIAGRELHDVNMAVLSLADWGIGPDGNMFNEISGVLGGSELLTLGAVIDFNSQKIWVRAKR